MRLYFLRHAKTEKQAKSGKDFDRGLVQRGLDQCKELSPNLNLLPLQKIVCSSAKRTQETRTEACPKDIETLYLDDLYLSGLEGWKNILRKHAGNQVLFLGHNEGISRVVSWLLELDVHMQTAALLTMDFMGEDPEALGPGTAQWIAYYRPLV